jgi:L-galactose dehydrogenase
MKRKVLGDTGLEVPELGFGAATLGDVYGAADPAETVRTVHLALDEGMNLFDTAPYYGLGLAEERLGAALKGRRRHALIATKCARYDFDRFDFSAASVRQSIEDSLHRLQTDYVDILHVHDVEFGSVRQIIDETIPELRRVQQEGKARFIGITGLSLVALRRIASETPVDCILSYCRYNLLNTDMDEILTSFTRSHGVGLFNASPLHMRLLAQAGPPSWHLAAAEVKEAARRIVQLCGRRGVAAPAVALQFALQHPDVACTVTGISNCDELRANLRAISARPDWDLIREIEEIARPVRGLIWPTGRPENYDPMVAVQEV